MVTTCLFSGPVGQTTGPDLETIIHLSEALNPKVDPSRLHQPRTAPTYTIVSFDPFQLGGVGGQKSYSGRVPAIFGPLWHMSNFERFSLAGGE